MCGGGECRCARISETHSNIGREILKTQNVKPYEDVIEDDADTAACRDKLSLFPDDLNAIMALGDALAFQMRYREALTFYERAKASYPECYQAHRKCAVRYMSTMDIEKSERELLWCDAKTADKGDTGYLLALCRYYRGDYRGAEETFAARRKYVENNDEMNVAFIYWMLLCRVKTQKTLKPVLELMRDDLKAGHHVGYMQAVKLFQSGDIATFDVVDKRDELNVSIYLYGLYHYFLSKKKHIAAAAVFEDMLNMDTYFSSFAYLGAYSEKSASQRTDGNKID